MCFDNGDCEWTAEVNESAEHESGPVCHCTECGSVIAADRWRRTVHQQEYEACQICEDDCSDSYIDREEMNRRVADGDATLDWIAENRDAADAADQLATLDHHAHAHDYGESYDYVCCLGCEKILRAIEAHEAAEGCPVDARRPMLGNLAEEIINSRGYVDYRGIALAAFPELADHPLLETK